MKVGYIVFLCWGVGPVRWRVGPPKKPCKNGNNNHHVSSQLEHFVTFCDILQKWTSIVLGQDTQDAIVEHVENEGSIGTPDGHGCLGSIYPWFFLMHSF